ncbi:MAG TPA: hypothetical protein VN783_03560 [Thermoanaerobaculia bacterium]|nr:hypothetical protein [Thermoanaerobaculia bacterium]
MDSHRSYARLEGQAAESGPRRGIEAPRAARYVPAGGNLAIGKTIDPNGNVLRLQLPRKVAPAERVLFTVTVRNRAGHRTQVVRTYKP